MSNFHLSADSGAGWRLAPDAGLRLHCWDGECVVWHGASGDTHRLPEAVGQLLASLRQASATASELSQAVDLHQDDVDAALAELARLGIVEAAS